MNKQQDNIKLSLALMDFKMKFKVNNDSLSKILDVEKELLDKYENQTINSKELEQIQQKIDSIL